MNPHLDELAKKYFSKAFAALSETEKKILQQLSERSHVSRIANQLFEEQMTFGQRLADKIAAFGGSWPFVILFLLILLSWMALNSIVLSRWGTPFDPYPFILLNLFLSTLAAIQAPVILMSQNRQSQKDRFQVQQDYEVDLKAELEIMALRQQVDELLAANREQQEMLQKILDHLNVDD